jgi:hypothetical protein
MASSYRGWGTKHGLLSFCVTLGACEEFSLSARDFPSLKSA